MVVDPQTGAKQRHWIGPTSFVRDPLVGHRDCQAGCQNYQAGGDFVVGGVANGRNEASGERRLVTDGEFRPVRWAKEAVSPPPTELTQADAVTF